MAVDSVHPQYSKNLPKWQLVRDCDEGSQAIKSRSIGKLSGTAYLPQPNPTDTSKENDLRYGDYRTRANFVNFTGHTKDGMTGMVFRKETKVDLATDIEYLIDNANGGGLTADQMIKDVSGDVLMVGRYGLLVEYPQTEPGMTQSQVAALNLRANIKTYPAESVINWRTENIGGVTMLTMVVLQEPTEKVADDGFSYEEVMYHRVLLLSDGVYVQNLYDEDGEQLFFLTDELADDGAPVATGEISIFKSDGSSWNEIPFIFVGSENNDPTVDKAPLYDIAEVNIAHYRNSADYEESSYQVGQPTPWISGLTQSWVDSNFKDGIQLGSRAGVMLPEGGSMGLAQADPNQMPLAGMEKKEQQMIAIGARIIQDQGGVETAEAAKIRFAGQNSKLGSIIINVEAAFTQCFTWAMEFMGGTQEPEVEINKELYKSTIDPQLLMGMIQMQDRGIIATADTRRMLRQADLIESTRTDEEIDGEAEIEPVL